MNSVELCSKQDKYSNLYLNRFILVKDTSTFIWFERIIIFTKGGAEWGGVFGLRKDDKLGITFFLQILRPIVKLRRTLFIYIVI